MRLGAISLLLAAAGSSACAEASPRPESRPTKQVVERRRVSSCADDLDRATPARPPVDVPEAVIGLRGREDDGLMSLLATTRGRLRRDVVYELARRGPPAALRERLIDLAHDEDCDLAAAHALVRISGARDVLVRRIAAIDFGQTDVEFQVAETARSELRFVLDEMDWLDPPPPVVDTREPSSAPPPPPPSIEWLRTQLASDDRDARTEAAIAAGRRGEAARCLIPLVAEVLSDPRTLYVPRVATAMRELDAEREALLLLRARMARARSDELRECVEALAALGPVARMDVEAHVGALLESDCEFDRAQGFDAIRLTESSVTLHRDALVLALREGEWDLRAAAQLVAARPVLARDLLSVMSAALPDSHMNGWTELGRAILAAGGLSREDALRCLDTVEPALLRTVLNAIGPESAAPGDELALRLFDLILTSDDDDVRERAYEALRRAEAIDARDTQRLLGLLERRGLGWQALGEICRTSTAARPRLLRLLEAAPVEAGWVEVTWPIAMLGPRAKAALPRLVLEARNQHDGAAFAVGAIGVAGVEPLRRALDGQHETLRDYVIDVVLHGVCDTAGDRDPGAVDAACRGYLSILAEVPVERVTAHLSALSVHEHETVRWAADRLR